MHFLKSADTGHEVLSLLLRVASPNFPLVGQACHSCCRLDDGLEHRCLHYLEDMSVSVGSSGAYHSSGYVQQSHTYR